MLRLLPLFSLILSTSAVMAQHHGHMGHQQASSAQHSSNAYVGMQSREIKALSPQHIEGLRGGKGLGMAMPAELNGYPGPAHVLELSVPLKLSEDQIHRTRELFSEMEAQAKTAGERVIVAEGELDRLFKDKQATAENVSAAVAKAALAQGQLRDTHLRYHLIMMDVLTPSQVQLYSTLRGY